MVKHTILVEDDQDALLTRLIDSGQFHDVSEAARAALRLLEDDEAKRTALRARLSTGYDEAILEYNEHVEANGLILEKERLF